MVIGRYVSLWCRFWNHAEPLWSVRAEGVGFCCPTCQRFKVSPVLKALR